MLLSHKTTIKVNTDYACIIGHMCHAASKLWNICNYERRQYRELGLTQYPDWYYQKKAHKDDFWYKQLPAQTAQEICKLLDKAYTSYVTLKRTGGIAHPNPPRFKRRGIAITYMQMGIRHEPGTAMIRLSLPKQLMRHLSDAYGIHDTFIYLENQLFERMDTIKQIKIYPPQNDTCEIIVIYEIPDIEPLQDNGHYLSIDLGLHNTLACFDSANRSFLLGRKYLSICHYYNKEIACVQSRWYSQQAAAGVKYPKSSKHIHRLYRQRNCAIHDYLHKITRYITDYCIANDIHTVILGDITGIRQNNNKGHVVNQQLHGLPYQKIRTMLQYKLAMHGIRLILQKESYTSQCSPLSTTVGRTYARKDNRQKRGLYMDNGIIWNADIVGAYNILRLYLQSLDMSIAVSAEAIHTPTVIKVAV